MIDTEVCFVGPDGQYWDAIFDEVFPRFLFDASRVVIAARPCLRFDLK